MPCFLPAPRTHTPQGTVDVADPASDAAERTSRGNATRCVVRCVHPMHSGAGRDRARRGHRAPGGTAPGWARPLRPRRAVLKVGNRSVTVTCVLPNKVSSTSAVDRLIDPFEALGDPHRRTILRLLGERDRNVSELASTMPISRPAVSRHLRVLREAGLVTEHPRGTQRIYALRAEGVEAVRAYLEQVWGEAATRYRIVAQNSGGRSR
jgi:DNA-binding transcriptional ArsR family regulator